MTAFTAVLLYVVWMLLLAVTYAGPRIPLALLGKKSIDSWERGKAPVDPEFLQRAKSAHMNCVENFPLFAAVVAIAALMQQMSAVDGLAAYVLYARVAQSVTHIMGASPLHIWLRASFFLVQVALILLMIINLL